MTKKLKLNIALFTIDPAYELCGGFLIRNIIGKEGITLEDTEFIKPLLNGGVLKGDMLNTHEY